MYAREVQVTFQLPQWGLTSKLATQYRTSAPGTSPANLAPEGCQEQEQCPVPHGHSSG